MSYVIRFEYDLDEKRYFVLSSDIPGLNVEADTYEQFVEAVKDLAPHLIERADGSTLLFEQEIAMAV
jgi:predicted RNase H-like HicB family nuclease